MSTVEMNPAKKAAAIALALAEEAGAGDLALVAGRPGAEGKLLATLLGHELAIGHCLAARLAARANAFLERAGPDTPEGERAAREAARLMGGVARMIERYRLGVLGLARLRVLAKEAAKPRPRIIKLAWAGGIDTSKPDDPEGGPGGKGGAGGGNGGGGGGNGVPGGGSWGGGLPSPRPPGGAGPSGLSPAAPPRVGQLRHGNPSGDLSAVRRCGARTRAGTCCRQPAMTNGRCRLHGGKSTGPRTAEGLARARRARLVHGARSRELLARRSAAAHSARRLAHLTRAARADLPPPRNGGEPGWGLAGHGVHGPVSTPPPAVPVRRSPRRTWAGWNGIAPVAGDAARPPGTGNLPLKPGAFPPYRCPPGRESARDRPGGAT